MTITSKKELQFCLMADSMMNTGEFVPSFIHKLKGIFLPDLRMEYLICMRKLSYYRHKNNPIWVYYHFKYRKIGLKLGYSIGPNVFGYGLVLPHYGTIVVGPRNTIGNYAVIHVCTLITSTDKTIGDSLFASTGTKITSGKRLGNNVTIAANSVVTKSFDDNILLVGMPCFVKGERQPWWEYNEPFTSRHQRCEELRRKMFGDINP